MKIGHSGHILETSISKKEKGKLRKEILYLDGSRRTLASAIPVDIWNVTVVLIVHLKLNCPPQYHNNNNL